MRIAVIDKCPSGINYSKYFNFEFEVFHLSSIKLTKILKKDIDLEIDLSPFDYVVLIGSEAAKIYAGVTSVTDKAGHLVNEKFIPLTSPAVITFKPEAKPAFEKTLENLHSILEGNYNVNTDGNWYAITTTEDALAFLKPIADDPNVTIVALDTETTALYPRDGYVLGISVCAKEREAAYISSDAVDGEVQELLQIIIDTKRIVFHNAKFDMKMLSYHFNLEFNVTSTFDTLLEHYILDETQGSHGLKSLALKYTTYGDYDKALEEFKEDYCKKYKVLKADFTYDLIPFDTISTYAAIDTAVTLELHKMFFAIIEKNTKFLNLYRSLLMPALFKLTEMEDIGIPLSLERLKFADTMLGDRLHAANLALYEFDEVKQFEKDKGSAFNPNSVLQLRTLLFDYLGLTPTGKLTGTGAHSTDAEVLEELKSEHPVVDQILTIRRLGKIKNTYVDKLLPQIDRDGRIRTGFNLTSTTSGRLSSSGKFNAQQIVRDDPIVKGSIMARPGYKIVSQDLATAEMYVAAVLSGDKALQGVFSQKGDFHSMIAHTVFELPCEPSEVKKMFPNERQAAKAISFGILYGSGPQKVAETVGCSVEQAREYIEDYFNKFSRLKKWLKEKKEYIETNGYIYSEFGRKRRLKNVFSPDKGIASHEVRSGINFLVQSIASDVNVLAVIDAMNIIKTHRLDAKVFMLVHDSIVAEVREDHVEQYCSILRQCTQKDRGVSVQGCPIGIDQDIGDDYSFGHYLEVYGDRLETWRASLPTV